MQIVISMYSGAYFMLEVLDREHCPTRKTSNMRVLLDLHLLNMCVAMHAYFKETTGTGPTRQLVKHKRFKGHLLWYLCGSQTQECSAFHLTGCKDCEYNRFLSLFGPLDIFSVWTRRSVLSLRFHWDCYTWDARRERDGLPDCNWTCNTTNSDSRTFPSGGTLSVGGTHKPSQREYFCEWESSYVAWDMWLRY